MKVLIISEKAYHKDLRVYSTRINQMLSTINKHLPYTEWNFKQLDPHNNVYIEYTQPATYDATDLRAELKEQEDAWIEEDYEEAKQAIAEQERIFAEQEAQARELERQRDTAKAVREHDAANSADAKSGKGIFKRRS